MGAVFIAAYVLNNYVFGPYFRLHTNGNAYLEMTVFYSPQSLYALLDQYGQQGRDFYVKSALLFDFIFPLQYSVFFTSLAYIIYRNLSGGVALGKAIFFLGIALCLSDWLENIFLLLVIYCYPGEIAALAYLANAMTLLKTGLTMLLLAGSLISATSLLVKRCSSR
jgi:uncharacterized protein YhhL (DUF1145 family)